MEYLNSDLSRRTRQTSVRVLSRRGYPLSSKKSEESGAFLRAQPQGKLPIPRPACVMLKRPACSNEEKAKAAARAGDRHETSTMWGRGPPVPSGARQLNQCKKKHLTSGSRD